MNVTEDLERMELPLRIRHLLNRAKITELAPVLMRVATWNMVAEEEALVLASIQGEFLGISEEPLRNVLHKLRDLRAADPQSYEQAARPLLMPLVLHHRLSLSTNLDNAIMRTALLDSTGVDLEQEDQMMAELIQQAYGNTVDNIRRAIVALRESSKQGAMGIVGGVAEAMRILGDEHES